MAIEKVLYSPGFGAGWSTWANSEHRDFMLFDSRLVNALEAGTLTEKMAEKFLKDEFGPEAYSYLGGISDLKIEWIDKGSSFDVQEYDGAESIEFPDARSYPVA